MRLINTQYDENNQAISTLWVNDIGEYILKRGGIFTKIVENTTPSVAILSEEQIIHLQELYRNEMISGPVDPVDKRLILNPKKGLGDEVINRIR